MKTLDDWIKAKTANIPDVGTIRFDKVGICWDLTDETVNKPVIDTHVVNLAEAEANHEPDAGYWDSAGSTGGACFADWGRNPRHTPLGKIAEMCFDGDMPQGQHFVRLLKEFAKIEGCDWALHMFAALQMGQMVDHQDNELNI